MGSLIIFVILLILGILFAVVGMKKLNHFVCITGTFFALIFGSFIISMVFYLIANQISAPADAMVLREKYKALSYKVESGACRDEFGLLSKEIIDEVQEWNTELIYNKQMHDSFWVGICYPDIYDGLETIDYEKYNCN